MECFFRQHNDPGEMPISPLRFLAGFTQPIERELANRLQHSIARDAVNLLGKDETPVGQEGEELQDLARFDPSPLQACSAASSVQPPANTDDGYELARPPRPAKAARSCAARRASPVASPLHRYPSPPMAEPGCGPKQFSSDPGVVRNCALSIRETLLPESDDDTVPVRTCRHVEDRDASRPLLLAPTEN